MLNRQFRLLACAALAVVTLGAAVGAASASRGFSITNGVTLATASGTLTFTTSGLTIPCTVTLGIGLNSSVSKLFNSPIGTLLPSPATGCTLMITGTVLGGTLHHNGFFGTLPNNISAFGTSLRGFGVLLQTPIVGSCLWGGTLTANLRRITTTGALDSIKLSGTPGLVSGTGCPATLTVSGSLPFAAPQPIYQLI